MGAFKHDDGGRTRIPPGTESGERVPRPGTDGLEHSALAPPPSTFPIHPQGPSAAETSRQDPSRLSTSLSGCDVWGASVSRQRNLAADLDVRTGETRRAS